MASNVIAIDGPAASGKSSAARLLAQNLKAAYISTGEMYRALAWKMLGKGLDPERITEEELQRFLESTSVECCCNESGIYEIVIDGTAPGKALHTQEVSAGASRIAVYGTVRSFLLSVQRRMAGETLLVMEGRDIGTEIFPDAKYKFFLTATPEKRALRRLCQNGNTPSEELLKQTAQEIAARDEQDRNRALAPLRQAEDALYVDNSLMDLDETVAFLAKVVRNRKAALENRLVLRYRVPFADTDQMGVVYYGNYYKYFEMFRTELLVAIGASYDAMEKGGTFLPVIESHCNYHAPARFEDILEITGRVSQCKGVRCKISCEVYCRGKLLAEGYTIHAGINAKGRPVRVPEIIAKMLVCE